MCARFPSLGLLAFLFGPVPFGAAQTLDYVAPQSPPKPVPGWVKYVDQGTNDARLKGYVTPAGIKVQIVADYPTVVNPVGMTFGDDGTPFVLEWRPDPPGSRSFPEHPETIRYKDGTTRTVVTMKKQNKDAVKTLRENNRTYDRSTLVLEEELPSSILLHDGWLYISGRGTVRRYRQSKSGGPYDVKEVIAQGFCGFHHHQVSGLSIGNDGWLYITSGDDDNYVEGSDGSRATVLRTGAVFRCRPDGSKMHVYSQGYRNPYRDVAFDAAFNIFHADNDNEDGSKFTGCRLMHVAEESDFGWRLRTGARCCTSDNARGAVFGELPGKLPPLLKTGRGSPAGLLIYNDTFFPEHYRGLLLYPDVFRRLIRAYHVEPHGSTFQVVEEFELMKSDDPLFRPCQMVLGPDGAMYVCDWRTNSGGAGQLWGDGKHGRIYRLSWTGPDGPDGPCPAIPLRGTDAWAKIARLPDAELLQTLASPNFSDRQKAQRELVRRGEGHRPSLLKLVRDPDQPLPGRIAALGVLEMLWGPQSQSALIELLRIGEADLRRLAAEGLGLLSKMGDPDVHHALLQSLGDPEPAVRRAVALAIGRVAAPGAEDSLVKAFQFEDGDDQYLRDGLVRAIERLGKPVIDRLLALAESGVDKDRDKVVEAFLGLRTRPAAEAMPSLLKYPHMTPTQRAALVRSYGNYLLDPPLSLGPLVEYLLASSPPPAVKVAGLEILSLGGVTPGTKISQLLANWLDDPDPTLRAKVIQAVENARVTAAVPRLANIFGDGTRPENERAAAARALRTLPAKAAVPALRDLLADANKPVAPALRAEAMRTLNLLDPDTAYHMAQGFLSAKDATLQSEAIQALGARPAGARLVADKFLAHQLPPETLALVTDALRKHADKDQGLAKLLTEVMKGGLLLSLDKDRIERVQHLVKTKGDPRRGRQLYLSARTLACVKCHRLEGVGGNVGPDLTRIWDTHSVEKIMESIIEPSKEIKEGYQTYVATTTKGLVFTGLKVSQTKEEVVLRDADAREVRLPARDVEELLASKKSLMPDNVVAQLSFDQFIDLVAFLKDRPAQESLRGLALEFWVVGPFGGDLNAAYPPEDKPEPTATYPGPKTAKKLRWQPRDAEANGFLDLRAVFDKEYITAYALTYVYSPKAQKVRMLVGSDDMVKIWVNGTVVHAYAGHRVPAPDQDNVEVTLREGWNPVLCKVVNLIGGHGLYLRFAGPADLRIARTPEAK